MRAGGQGPPVPPVPAVTPHPGRPVGDSVQQVHLAVQGRSVLFRCRLLASSWPGDSLLTILGAVLTASLVS